GAEGAELVAWVCSERRPLLPGANPPDSATAASGEEPIAVGTEANATQPADRQLRYQPAAMDLPDLGPRTARETVASRGNPAPVGADRAISHVLLRPERDAAAFVPQQHGGPLAVGDAHDLSVDACPVGMHRVWGRGELLRRAVAADAGRGHQD